MHHRIVQWDPAAVWREVSAESGLADPAPGVDLAANPPVPARWPSWVPTPVVAQLAARGISEPYLHQVQTADAAWAGSDVALAAGTATGKTLAYSLPILAAIGDDDALPATTLYLSPTKALAQDQLRAWQQLTLPGLRAASYDGDTPAEERRWARRHASVIVSNPDMLHAGILPNHAAWQSFLKRLRFVVVDEFHVYRGLFGANLSAILRRLLRIAEHYGGRPVVIGTSATVEDPAQTLQTLTGRPAVAVAPPTMTKADTHLRLVAPHDDGLLARTAAVLAGLVARDVRTLAFVRSRRAAEVVSLQAQQRLRRSGLQDRVASYRSGYLPEERRALERGLREGRYLGLAATSALELGIDISGLDAVVVAGWPGTTAALRQRLGRAGRGGRAALAVFMADNDPLDSHLVRNPQRLVHGLEAMVIDAANPYVLGPHLCAAAAELPLTEEAAARSFGPTAAALLPALAQRGMLRHRPSGWYWTRPERACDLADIRGIRGEPVAVIEAGTGRLIGSVDAGAAGRTVHPGAVYTHQGEDYLVAQLDLDNAVAAATLARLPYSTHAQSTGDTRLLDVLQSAAWGPVTVQFGVVEVSTQVVGFLKRRLSTGEVLGQEPLDLPVRTLRTKALWWTVPEEVLQAARITAGTLPGAAHAAEHAAIGMLPLFAQCDRWDIGGLSTPHHPDTGACTIVVYDGLPGGAGFAERGFHAAAPWLRATMAAVSECACTAGCPSCVQSPKCGNGNEPLDKGAAVALMAAMLAVSPTQ